MLRFGAAYKSVRRRRATSVRFACRSRQLCHVASSHVPPIVHIFPPRHLRVAVATFAAALIYRVKRAAPPAVTARPAASRPMLINEYTKTEETDDDRGGDSTPEAAEIQQRAGDEPRNERGVHQDVPSTAYLLSRTAKKPVLVNRKGDKVHVQESEHTNAVNDTFVLYSTPIAFATPSATSESRTAKRCHNVAAHHVTSAAVRRRWYNSPRCR